MGEPVDPKWFRQVLGEYPTGVCVVTAADPEGGYAGLTVGSFTSVSLEPPLVAFLPDKSSTTWPRLERARRFCVNVLAADQEYVCRAFATKAADKFAGLDWRPARSGAPILAGVSAWIDCDLEVVHDAGDHHIVIGRVRELDIEDASLPLLFFQGGYGRFVPQSLVTSDLKLIGHFRHIDLIRPELEALADAVGVECNASVRVGDEIVVIATAGQPRGAHIPTRVGHRYAMTPPVGAPFVAWSEESVIEAWLRRASPALSSSEREAYAQGLAWIRDHGYSMLVGTLDPAPVDAAGAPVVPGDLRRFIQDVRMGFGPEDVPSSSGTQWVTIYAPVFDEDGEVALMITLYGFDSTVGVEGCTLQLTAVSQRITELTGGRAPAFYSAI